MSNATVFHRKARIPGEPVANLFKELGTFERSLNFQIDILHFNDLKIFPSYALIKSWNSLPLYLKRSETLNIFKKTSLKTFLEKYIVICNSKLLLL